MQFSLLFPFDTIRLAKFLTSHEVRGGSPERTVACRSQDSMELSQMSNTSLREQLEAVASKLSTDVAENKKPTKPILKNTPKFNEKRIKKPKPQWLEQVQYGVELLKAYFPNCFKSAYDVQPLKIGIKQDLVKFLSTVSEIVTEDKACMVKSLSYYVNMPAYLKSVQVGRERIDLHGQTAGVVTEEEANYSQERHKNKMKNRQEAKPNAQELNQP